MLHYEKQNKNKFVLLLKVNLSLAKRLGDLVMNNQNFSSGETVLFSLTECVGTTTDLYLNSEEAIMALEENKLLQLFGT